MRIKIFILLSLSLLLIGCTGVIPSENLTGYWTMFNTTTETTSSLITVDSVTTSQCKIVDDSGSLTIYYFRIVGLEFIDWNKGYGTFNNSVINAKVNGHYSKPCGQLVDVVIYFEGTIDGINGVGNWTQAFSISCNFDYALGMTIFTKGG